jgi:hypothetical protein
MAKKSNTKSSPAGLSDEQRITLLNLYLALGTVLGNTSGTQADPGAAPADADEPADDDGGLSDLGGDDGLGDESGDDLEDEAPAVTMEDVRAQLKKVLAKHGDKGKAKVAAILGKFGAKTMPELDEEKFQACIDLAKKHS